MQETRGFKPSNVSRRFSEAAGFYRTCVIDGLLEHSPAEHGRRPAVSAQSPTLGFTHPQFEALLTTARESSNPCNFALVAMLGLLGLRIFEATAADIADLGEEHGHRVLRVCGKGAARCFLIMNTHGLEGVGSPGHGDKRRPSASPVGDSAQILRTGSSARPMPACLPSRRHTRCRQPGCLANSASTCKGVASLRRELLQLGVDRRQPALRRSRW
jgi:hypothetical protein